MTHSFLPELTYKYEPWLNGEGQVQATRKFALRFNGVRVMQVVGVENLFFIIREVIPVANVIEVGTAHGGLANILASVFTDLTVHTYDIISWEPEIFKENIQVHLSDCWAPAFIDEYQSTLKDGVTLFVIDGGDKAKEINIISRHAKRGDILMVHDYCTDEVEFQATGKQIWNYLEIQESDIELELLKRSDLFSEGLKFAWGIYEGTAIPEESDFMKEISS